MRRSAQSHNAWDLYINPNQPSTLHDTYTQCGLYNIVSKWHIIYLPRLTLLDMWIRININHRRVLRIDLDIQWSPTVIWSKSKQGLGLKTPIYHSWRVPHVGQEMLTLSGTPAVLPFLGSSWFHPLFIYSVRCYRFPLFSHAHYLVLFFSLFICSAAGMRFTCRKLFWWISSSLYIMLHIYYIMSKDYAYGLITCFVLPGASFWEVCATFAYSQSSPY